MWKRVPYYLLFAPFCGHFQCQGYGCFCSNHFTTTFVICMEPTRYFWGPYPLFQHRAFYLQKALNWMVVSMCRCWLFVFVFQGREFPLLIAAQGFHVSPGRKRIFAHFWDSQNGNIVSRLCALQMTDSSEPPSLPTSLSLLNFFRGKHPASTCQWWSRFAPVRMSVADVVENSMNWQPLMFRGLISRSLWFRLRKEDWGKVAQKS